MAEAEQIVAAEAEKATPNMIYIENEGALFRGVDRTMPKEVWSKRAGAWKPYSGETPKPYEWGHEITEAEANEMMGKKPARAAA